MTERRISVVLPVYNEAENIAPCLRGLSEALRDEPHELLVCYDLEGDSTLPAIEAMPDRPPGVRLIKNPLGRGVASAIRAGFQASLGDVVVVMMADLSDPPAVIPAMARKIRSDGADVVSGSRYMPGGSQSGGPRLKTFLSRAAGLSLFWLGGLGTRDATTNFRAYRRSFLEATTIESGQGFELALELTVKAHLGGFRIAEVPSTWTDRSAGESRFRLWKWLPAYLRWYGAAMAGPFLAWGIALLLLGVLAGTGGTPGAVAGQGFLAAGVLLLARRLRGRTSAWDAGLAAAWLHGGFASAGARGNLLPVSAFAALASGIVLWSLREPGPTQRLQGRGSRALPFVAAVLWLSLLSFPEGGSRGLDPSWKRALGQFLLHDLQAGVDYVFTFGPLGAFYEPIFRDALFLRMLAWEIGAKFLMVLVFVRIWRSLEDRPSRVACAICGFVLLPIHSDPLYLLAILAAAVSLLRTPERPLQEKLPELLLLSALFWMKFSFAATAGVAMLIVLGSMLLRGPLRRAVLLGGLFGALLLLLWTLCGQRLASLPSYLGWSSHLSAAYSEAVGLPPQPGVAGWALLSVLAPLIPALCLLLHRGGGERRPATLLLLGAVLFFAWKAGMTRADAVHIRSVFIVASLAGFVVPLPWPAAVPARLLVRGTAALPGLLFLFAAWEVPPSWPGLLHSSERLHRNAETLLRPGSVRDRERVVADRLAGEAALPQIRERVGDRSVDVLSVDVDAVLLNGLRWAPRPVFQSYLAFTPSLMELNGRFLASSQAPDFVLYRAETVDHRFSPMEDSRSLLVLARNYRPLLQEGGFLLLKRRLPAEALGPSRRGPSVERRVAWGESVDLRSLPGSVHVVRLVATPTAKGRLVRTLTSGGLLRLQFETDGGERRSAEWRPCLGEGGFLIDPVIPDGRMLQRWIEGEATPRCVSFRAIVLPGFEAEFVDGLEVRIECFDGIP